VFNDANNSDESTVNLIFQKLAVNIKPVTVQRFGKSNGKIRSLKLSLTTASDVF